MTASPEPMSKPSSRRALLAGALGGLGALAASAIGRASPVRAGSDGDVVLGVNNFATGRTYVVNQTNDQIALGGEAYGSGTGVYGISAGTGVWGISTGSGATNYGVGGSANGGGTGVYGLSTSGKGVYGLSTSGQGVYGESSSSFGVVGTSPSGGVSGTSTNGTGVYGSSGISVGVRAYSNATSAPAAQSWSAGNSTGVLGYSGDSPPAALANTGVYGVATQDSTARGVIGETTSGHGVHGTATTGYAGFFNGKVFTNKFHEMAEMSTPTAPSANKARLFVRDNGSGKTQLCVRFPTGAVQVIKTEP
jgi:hypothetical protein